MSVDRIIEQMGVGFEFGLIADELWDDMSMRLNLYLRHALEDHYMLYAHIRERSVYPVRDIVGDVVSHIHSDVRYGGI